MPIRKGFCRKEYSRIDLIRGITANHVEHSEFPAWMFVKPAIKLENSAICDDNDMPGSNLAFNHST